MSNWQQRWAKLAPREQWLAFGVGLALLGLAYLLAVADPLARRIDAEQGRARLAEARALEARNALQELQAKLAADPNRSYRESLQAARAERERLLRGIDRETRALVTPARMKGVLQELLRSQPKLRLLALDSFSEPLALPGAEAAQDAAAAAPLTLYRHGLRLTLEGGYFELLAYVRAIEASGWRLYWDSLDYQVGEAGPGQARIVLQLHTLSRDEGWVGV